METGLTITKLFSQENVKKRFQELLGKKSTGFMTSVIQATQSNKLLMMADPSTIMTAAATAAALDLPINQNLGFAWIVPYKGQAQFQMGWKGYVQLALRTGQYQRINVTEVYDNQFKSFNRLTEELDADFSEFGKGDIVGYAAYFRLNNGMEKTVYWTKEEVVRHAEKYSQAYGKSFSPWSDKDQFHAMAKKTVLKNIISKWGIMSIEMQTAHLSDQSVQREEGNYEYIDNPNFMATENEVEYIKSLLVNAEIPEEEKDGYDRELEGLTSVRAGELIEFLKENQVNPISAGLPFNQGDIKDKIAEEVEIENEG